MTINCHGELLDLTSAKIMGIINITPDSFYENSRASSKDLLKKAEKMLEQGADLLDIGGYSSRPGATEVSQEEELRRVVPVVKTLVKTFPKVRISVDTFRSEVARQSLLEGACMINDISAGHLDEKMWQIIADFQVPYIAMHMKGTPKNMQEHTHYQDIVKEMIFYFSQIKAKAQQYGINDLIIDPGFGFSKTLEQNYEILRKLSLFRILDVPILVGVSRKSMLYRLLQTTAENALNATTIVNTLALTKGAHILRVHDVQQAKECVQIFEKMEKL
ncbi:Dihydropteroate synthase [Capnocytophaga canimorsus]|uniref:dihydropteroate synthase n=1 Tax=Capnocytophaga canimorsus TaxID=28188 RepID=A0A0B7HRY5_9FLAO|nr:dihydropteroate synthase [Capnocytophaga canimorsus]ATA76823.1 dihydropteroate synthase [Capnocytophaga canimorsus]PJI84053.1 dihydropteroate synthase [Capnocytophaga canimorsus]CEN40318.1 Dihydropteroate synthase [Capnocytophaga canimorsus]STA72021.1 Dihydropteroate synthase [Capnocytophaga canimorsus]